MHSASVTVYFKDKIPKNTLRIIYTVHLEVNRKMYEIVSREASKSGYRPVAIRRLADRARSRYNGLLGRGVFPDERGAHLDSVKELYSGIWTDCERNASKLDKWARIKHGPKIRGRSDIKAWKNLSQSERRRMIRKGPPTGNDLIILATAAKLAETHKTVLFTFDHDFIIFGSEITKCLDIEIKDGYLPDAPSRLQ